MQESNPIAKHMQVVAIGSKEMAWRKTADTMDSNVMANRHCLADLIALIIAAMAVRNVYKPIQMTTIVKAHTAVVFRI